MKPAMMPLFVSTRSVAINSLESRCGQSALRNKELHMNLVTLNLTRNTSPPSRPRLFSSVTSMLAPLTGLDTISRAERTLNQLPDELLADMGITRSEIAEAVRFGRGDDGRS